jgi:D-tyrosyl-tRNA(Tyr) deacylase
VTVKSYVVIDEVHERSVENDLLLATLRQMLIFASRKRSSAEAKILQVHVREAEGARAQLQGQKLPKGCPPSHTESLTVGL